MVGSRRGGVILNEHKRCKPEIMAFSNELVYEHVLELIGGKDHNKLFGSNLVAFNIRGLKAAQHYNRAELQACKEQQELFKKEAVRMIGAYGKILSFLDTECFTTGDFLADETVIRVLSGEQRCFGSNTRISES